MRPQGRTLSRCSSSETPRDQVSIGITRSTWGSTGGRAPSPEFQISRLSSNSTGGHSLLHSRTCSRPVEDTPPPAQVFCNLSYLGPQRPLLSSLWVCFCTWESSLVRLPRVLPDCPLPSQHPGNCWSLPRGPFQHVFQEAV